MTNDHERIFVGLEGALVVSGAPELRDRLLESFDRASIIDLDLSRAEEIDVSCLQILVAARKTAANEGKDLGIFAAGSAALLEQAERCGIAPADLPKIRSAGPSQASTAP